MFASLPRPVQQSTAQGDVWLIHGQYMALLTVSCTMRYLALFYISPTQNGSPSKFTSSAERSNALLLSLLYQPQSNRILERWHRTLKISLKCQQNPRDWHQTLRLVLLGLRSPPETEIDSSVQRCRTTRHSARQGTHTHVCVRVDAYWRPPKGHTKACTA